MSDKYNNLMKYKTDMIRQLNIEHSWTKIIYKHKGSQDLLILLIFSAKYALQLPYLHSPPPLSSRYILVTDLLVHLDWFPGYRQEDGWHKIVKLH